MKCDLLAAGLPRVMNSVLMQHVFNAAVRMEGMAVLVSLSEHELIDGNLRGGLPAHAQYMAVETLSAGLLERITASLAAPSLHENQHAATVLMSLSKSLHSQRVRSLLPSNCIGVLPANCLLCPTLIVWCRCETVFRLLARPACGTF